MIIKNISLLLILSISIEANSSLNYLNNLRVKSGCSSLKWNNKLAYAAKKHAIYLASNRRFTHNENSHNRNFYAQTPWQRIVKAGFDTRAVVENITFYEPTFKNSIDKVMATVYHRLAFLDTKVDTIGFARYKNIYVYDMSNSKIANLCKYSNSSGLVTNICKKSSKTLAKNSFYSAINSTKKRSNSIIYYPYRDQRDVKVKLERETPSFLSNSSRYGYPVTVSLNSAYYSSVRLKKFKLFRNKIEVPCKIVTFRNDRRKKIDKNSFVLIPKKRLLHKRVYKVLFEAVADGKIKKVSWSFTTN